MRPAGILCRWLGCRPGDPRARVVTWGRTDPIRRRYHWGWSGPRHYCRVDCRRCGRIYREFWDISRGEDRAEFLRLTEA